MTSPREALERAKAHLRDESVWSRGYIARTAFGAPCMPNARCARAWSVRGALHAANTNVDAVFYAERALLAALPATHRTLGDFNDDPATTHADVLALLDRAIALAREEESACSA